MRKIFTLATALLLGATMTNAQTVADFDTLSLTGTDTFYVNYSSPGNDVGFSDGLAYFPCVYDTAGYKGWRSGFAYTNSADVADSSYTNLYTSVTGKGYNNSDQYLAVSAFSPVKIHLTGKAQGQPVKGFYATNLVYAYKEMSQVTFSKKFGGATGNDPDWFKVTIKGYYNGTTTTDSVDFYLADYRDADSTKDYIVTDWEWVDLQPLGKVDSLMLSLSSTDTAGGFGMNNPSFFCMDNFETFETSSVSSITTQVAAKVYPNPAANVLYVETNSSTTKNITITDLSGKVVSQTVADGSKVQISTSQLPAGVYLLHLNDELGTATTKFIKR